MNYTEQKTTTGNNKINNEIIHVKLRVIIPCRNINVFVWIGLPLMLTYHSTDTSGRVKISKLRISLKIYNS